MTTPATIDDRAWRQRRWTAFGLGIAVILMLLPVTLARAEGESLGCLRANTAPTDGGSSMTIAEVFNAGEVITVDVTNPAPGTTTARLKFDGADVDTISVPGTLEYTIPPSGATEVTATVDGTATFDFTCTAGSDDTTDTTEPLPPEPVDTELHCASGKAFGKHISDSAETGKNSKDGSNPGNHNGYATCVHDGTDFNNGRR